MAKQVNLTRHLKIVEKIPFVKGLSLHQVQQVLKAGSLETMQAGQVLCRDGEKSTAI